MPEGNGQVGHTCGDCGDEWYTGELALAGLGCPDCEEDVIGLHNVGVEFHFELDDDGNPMVAKYVITADPHDGPIMASCKSCGWADEPSFMGTTSDVVAKTIEIVNEHPQPRLEIT